MSSINRYYKANEEVSLRFYQMPKVLFTNPKYQKLSLGAKATYSILRDRQEISIKNNWVDDEGLIYLVFDVDTLANLLQVTRKTAIKYKKELVKFDLLVDKRRGQGRANRIYVLKPETVENTEYIQKCFQKCKNSTSRSVESTLLEVEKIHTNETDLSKTNRNNNNERQPDKAPTSTGQPRKSEGQASVVAAVNRFAKEKIKLDDQKLIAQLVCQWGEKRVRENILAVLEYSKREIINNLAGCLRKACVQNWAESSKTTLDNTGGNKKQRPINIPRLDPETGMLIFNEVLA